MRRLLDLGRMAHRLQPVRFLMAGGVNTLFGYTVYLVGLGLRLAPEVALAVATAIGAVFNYFSTARFVFGHKALNLLPVFIATYALLYVVNALVIQVLLRADIAPALAQALLVLPMAALSFLAFRTIVFRSVRPR